MSASSWNRTRRIAVAVTVLPVVTVAAGAVVVAPGASVHGTWWPPIGRVFGGGSRSARHHACGGVMGLGKAYGERGGRRNAARAGGLMVPACAGAADPAGWRRNAAGRRRR